MPLGRWGGSEGVGPRAAAGSGSELSSPGIRAASGELFEGPEGVYQVNRWVYGTFTRDTSLASGTQVVTGLPFKIKGLIVFMLDSAEAAGFASWGLSDNTAAGTISQGGLADNNNIVANAYSDMSNLIRYIVSSGNKYEGDLLESSGNSFTINWTRTGTPTGTMKCHYLAHG